MNTDFHYLCLRSDELEARNSHTVSVVLFSPVTVVLITQVLICICLPPAGPFRSHFSWSNQMLPFTLACFWHQSFTKLLTFQTRLKALVMWNINWMITLHALKKDYPKQVIQKLVTCQQRMQRWQLSWNIWHFLFWFLQWWNISSCG